ncbi:hypothetical protein [Duganella qianjiadongensis]|uniref:Phage exported protein n=1 Tax=Duganella qianjiadongensis TaxID=2692176 RepID=A0ABW9VJ10_9BURK|nr:hypothetical protein [Duganella qianjiadongensis]MYM39438.1 hypothetical protein [Duganella qianjiadongensis]
MKKKHNLYFSIFGAILLSIVTISWMTKENANIVGTSFLLGVLACKLESLFRERKDE